jgi:NAD+ synthase (glutamine-hydrolysing)
MNFHVGDIGKNLAMHIEAAEIARDKLHADLIVFPELGLTGYPPEDLLLRGSFINDCDKALHEFTSKVHGIHCLIGHPQPSPHHLYVEHHLYNSCSLVYNGKIFGTYSKFHLPNYGVFDECRYFDPKDEPFVFNIKGLTIGVVICEDIWAPGPLEKSIAAGARAVIVTNASPFIADKHEQRVAIMSKLTQQHQIPLFYVNNVGGQDELVFDGGSMVMNQNSEVSHFCGFFNETLAPVDVEFSAEKIEILPEQNHIEPLAELERIYQALVIGTRDYIQKNGFPGVLIGLSGGIDSALTCAIAADALGPERVHGVLMPSRYTADISNDDAHLLAKNLGVQTSTVSIESMYQSALSVLASEFGNKKPDVTEENMQSRCRGLILMALSNSTGKIVLTTGNRSEVAVGYCTLYGDMCGGYAVLKNVPKTLVYELANYRNSISPVIPERTIHRAPSAELAPNQTDQDTLPPYDILDNILYCYLNLGQGIHEITAQGFDKAMVKRVIQMIHRNEYKRKQYAVGPQIQHTSFIKDWRYPITNGFKG